MELLKTKLLDIGMNTNWDGLLKAIGIPIPGVLSQMGEKKGKKADNKGTPFCLTEEFAAVYRLHSLSPPGLILGDGDKNDEFIELANLLGDKGRKEMRKSKTRPKQMMKSCLHWPCGALMSSNYPNAYRNIAPTDDDGNDLAETENIDLASLDLFRDRERGILKFNEFRRQLNLKPYRTWMELTRDNEDDARRLELMYVHFDYSNCEYILSRFTIYLTFLSHFRCTKISYGPGQKGIEKCDLLVGDMYEGKVQPSFALSETSFIIFLAMASRRLDADPFLNELYNEDTYSKFGLKLVKENKGLFDLLERHYPDLAADFKDKKGKPKQSVFKPILPVDKWAKAIEDKVVPGKLSDEWATTKKRNEEFFDKLEAETEIYTKNLKANSKEIAVFDPSSIWIVLSILLVLGPFYIFNTYVDHEVGIKPMFPVDSINVAKECATSNVRHNSILNKVSKQYSPITFYSGKYCDFLISHINHLFFS